jgi:trehalose-6-phosphatase
MNMAYNQIKRTSLTKWTESFLKDLKNAYKPIEASYYLGINFKASKNRQGKNTNRLMQVRHDFAKLNIENCAQAFLKSHKCVIMIEIESLPHLKFSKQSIPTFEVIEQLHGLLTDNRNTVVILGNQTKDTLTEWFGRSHGFNNGNDFWLVAESGYLYKPGNKEPWKNLCEIPDIVEMRQVRKIMQVYASNVEGAFIEEQQSCLIFNYKNAEIEHGNIFIQDLYQLVQKQLKGINHGITYGNGFL